ncbi:MAG: hypothetical protein GY751_02600, partial [Bacteroidetes bacterium]|nr:hypothetical protein [Bacteroidota bacterium]
ELATLTGLGGSPIVIDDSGNIYFSLSSHNRVVKMGPPPTLSNVLGSGDIAFTEENGLAHIMTKAGRHKATINSDTGTVLRRFEYDNDKNLAYIYDRFNNEIRIERDGNGVPTAIVSPDNIRTSLTIDANNLLRRVTYEDDTYYQFDYTDGLMTFETEPNGNIFEHEFNSSGRLTDIYDEEEGHWEYDRTVLPNGDILTEILTAEGNLTKYQDTRHSTGKFTSTITGPANDVTLYSKSADGLTVNKSLSCGMDLEFKYGVDPEYKYKYTKETTKTTPEGLKKVLLRDRTYTDTDNDEVPDLISKTITVNGKKTTFLHNVLSGQKTITSQENRTVTATYDRTTLLTSAISVPELHDITYKYDTRGRVEFIQTGTRKMGFTYDSRGYVETVTDPMENVTEYDYDLFGRVKEVRLPDTITVMKFDYDENGNMKILTNPSEVNHVFDYNKVNLNKIYKAPLSGYYIFEYDRDRRLKQIKFPSTKQIDYVYEKTRLMQVQLPEGNVDYTYYCGTKVKSISKGTESIVYAYDASLVKSETLSGILNQELSYKYNDDFNLTEFTYAGSMES